MKTDQFYTVQPNDTLSGISRKTGVSISDLAMLNGIRNPNRIAVGEKLALNKEAVCGVSIQFLDKDHNPLRDLSYVVKYCGKEISGKTDQAGRGTPIMTESPTDEITVFVHRIAGELKEVATVVSGYANKLVTIVSPKLKLESKTHPHPSEPPENKPTGTSSKNNLPLSVKTSAAQPSKGSPQSWWGQLMGYFGIKLEESTAIDGKPVAKVTNNGAVEPTIISTAKQNYTGEKISDDDYADAAKKLGCEVEVIMAIGRQETKKSPFDSQNRPTVLYERHWFSRLTKHKFDDENPDISGKKYKKGSAKDKNNKAIDDGDHYGVGDWQYKKISKAAALDEGAALQATSWGKFQVMGFNYRYCGFKNVQDFVESMCISEKKHLEALVGYCKGRKLEDAMKLKDWDVIATKYNGTANAENDYVSGLKRHYAELILERASKLTSNA